MSQWTLLNVTLAMSQFDFKLLDTMGYQQDLTIAKDSVTCTSPTCNELCHHLTWNLHNIYKFNKDVPLIYKKQYSNSEWEKNSTSFSRKGSISTVSGIEGSTTLCCAYSPFEKRCKVCNMQKRFTFWRRTGYDRRSVQNDNGSLDYTHILFLPKIELHF
jgi:hypothetical protein